MKKNILVVFLSIFLIFGTFSCSDNKGDKEKVKVDNEKKQDLEKKVVNEKEADEEDAFNYSMKLDGKIDVKVDSKKNSEKVNISVGDFGIFSSKDALKQRLYFKDIKISNNKEFVNYSIDLIGNNFKNYFLLKFSPKKIKDEILKRGENSYPIMNNLLTSLKKDKYVMVDNEKIILKLLGDLSKNEVVKNLFLSVGVSNPKAFLEKTKTFVKLKEEFKKDKFLDYIFVNSGNPIKENGKTKQNLVLNDKICADYLPVFNNILSQIDDYYTPFDKKDCGSKIEQINSMLKSGVSIYKIGDLENGDFDFIIKYENIFEKKVSYKSHKIEYWEVALNSPNKKDFSFNISGDLEKIYKSSLKVDYSYEKDYIKGKVVNGNGNLIMNFINSNGKASGLIIFKDYFLENINFEFYEDNEKKGIIKGYFKKNECKINISLNNEFDFSLKYDKKGFETKLVFSSLFNKGEISVKYKKNYLKIDGYIDGKNTNFLYDNGKITGTLGEYTNLEGEIKNWKDFYIKIYTNKKDDLKIILQAKGDGEKTNYYFEEIFFGKLLYKLAADLTELKKDDYKSYNLKGEKIDENTKMLFDFELLVKKGGAKFEIPKDFVELEADISNASSLPVLNPKILKEYYKFVGKKIMPISALAVGVTSGIVYHTLRDYPRQARNTKRIQDISSLTQKLAPKLAYGNKLKSFVKNGKPLNVNGYSGEYGDINYEILGENKELFSDPTSKKSYKYLYLEGGEGKNRVKCFEIGAFLEEEKKNFVKGNCVTFSALSGEVENPKLGNSLFSQKGSKTLKDLIEKQ